MALGCNVPSKARALLRAIGSLNPEIENNFLSDTEALGVEMVDDQELCSYPDYDCSVWCICE